MFVRRSLTVLATTLTFACGASAAPAIWKVSDEDSSVWLFGSIHMLPHGMEWRTEIFDNLIDEADRIYFETDLGTEAQTRILALTMERGFARDGLLLNQRIDSKLMSKVRSAAETYAVPVPTLLAMQPWMAASTISVAALTAAGYNPTQGVETILVSEIPAERQGFLETAEQQIEAIAGGSEADQIQMLVATLGETDTLAEMVDSMVAAWLEGTPEVVADIFFADLGAYGDAFMDRLITQRNENWVAQIETMLANNEEAFLVVGAGHLVGPTSVVTLLEQKGFSSERVQ
ncbi:TraB/GumN family protein [Devosia sp.]|uniref:TraB/GumN family protein n=1 Tax=Devosia sp. TaxID=1871048 RepID=UPI001AC087AD|nr:TraB/GumN family protein [Devosia sp.]MBN9332330.1 TraB/GumN family protein [Devosia sp.]